MEKETKKAKAAKAAKVLSEKKAAEAKAAKAKTPKAPKYTRLAACGAALVEKSPVSTAEVLARTDALYEKAGAGEANEKEAKWALSHALRLLRPLGLITGDNGSLDTEGLRKAVEAVAATSE